MRRTSMKRTPFKRKNSSSISSIKGAENKPPNWPESHSQQALLAIISIVKMQPKNATSATTQAHVFRGGIPKSKPVRSEAYRRIVSSLPCCICGIAGQSQAAHGSGAGTAVCKGMGLKSCDLTCFPACALRCHPALDQGALFSKAVRHQLEPVWAADTQRRIYAMGLWPKGTPYPHDQQQGTACRTI